MKLKGDHFRVLLALVLALTILVLPLDTLALSTSNHTATPDEAANEIAATGAGTLSGDGSPENPYLIQSSDDWDLLSNTINSGGTEYSGKCFKLIDDISVTTVLGNRPNSSTDSNDNVFCGTFDGDGHKLTVNLSGSDFGAAPFAFAHNATIKNLRVDGTINSTAYHASGLVAASKGRSVNDESSLTIQNVTISVDISCTSHIAGVIGHAHAANITMENVVFDGSLNATNVQGGMIGWGGLGNGARFNATFKDCLFAGTYRSGAAFYPIAYANGQGTTTLVNDFYTTALGSGGSPIAPTGDGQLKLLAAQVEKDGSVKYFDNIATASNSANWTEGSTLKLMTDVNTGSTITVPSGAHTLDLNGHGIRMTGSGSVITVNNDATLNLDDSAPTTEHKFTVANAKSNGAGLATVNDTLTGEYKTFTGGYITGGSARDGGGIKVNGTADLTMNGGTIIGNQSSFMGAGIKADNNGDEANVNITVNGGAVIYNTVNGYGAGICSDGAVRINGGTIAYNVASNNPGGIHCHYLYINGGRVENNFAGATDYAAGAHADHEVFISGSPVINDNLVNGAPSNLDWDRTEYRHGHKLNLTDALTEGAKISVTMRVDGKGEFTNGWKDKMGSADPTKYFTSDDDEYKVILNSSGEAEIVEKSLFDGKGTEEEPYLIQSADDWDTLADSVLAGKTYDNKFFLLKEDITAERGIGSADITSATAPVYAFSGTFDGGGHTLDFIPPADTNANYVAPFSIVKNATIRNLKVTGKITAYNNLSGLVGATRGTLTIENVLSDVDVTGNFVGGFIGHGSSGDITLRSCAFTGDLNGTTLAGGLICWRGPTQWDSSSTSAVHMENCLFAGTVSGSADFHPIGFTQQTNVTQDFSNMWSTLGGKNNGKSFYNYQYQSASYKSTAATVTSGKSSSRPWMGYYDVIECLPVESTFTDAVNAWIDGSILALLTDVTTDSTITVPSGEHTLDLNGHGIRMTGSGSVINVGSGVVLDLYDSDTDATHKFDVPDGAGLAVLNEASGNYTVNGGYITGGNANPYGGGVCVAVSGKFNMYGGTIIGNNAVSHGGGVSVSGSNQAASSVDNFKMYGGAVSYNTANWGGGIAIYGKTYLYEKSIISNNTANSGGGGIELENNGRLYMSGGTVTENAVLAQNGGMWKGGGIHIPNGSECHIQGNVLIKDNYQETYGSKQNNLFIRKEVSGKVILDGELTLTAPIGVGTNGNAPFTVTAGYGAFHAATDPSKYFTSDDSNYAVILNNNGEAEIGVPPVASVINGDTTTSYSAISDAVNAWTAGSTLKLLTDVTTNSTITVPSGAHTLDLNGYALKAESAGYSVITVGSGAVLTIDDTSENVGKITGGSVGQNNGGGVTVDGGTLTLKGGAISGNANTYGGIGNCGGGVHVRNSGKFYMEGGEISGNTSYVGGGVGTDAFDATVVITGGVIKNNQTVRFGSAVFAGRTDSSIFRIGGDAQIVDNISTWTADKDGEASLNFSRLLLSGDPTVHGDWKTSGTSSPNTHINLDNNGSGIQTIELDGELTNSTGTPKITISPIYRWGDLKNGQTFVFTKNWNQYMGTAHPADYFKVDDSVSGVKIIRKNGEAAVTGSSDLGDLYITFDANEGEGEMGPQLAKTSSVQLNKNTFTHKDLVFGGWNTKKDGSGTAYADGANITLSGDLTLYAQWKESVASIISGETTTSYGSLSDAVSAWTAGSTLKLMTDVTTSSTITVPSGEHTLDLNGYKLDAGYTHRVITVPNGATLKIVDDDGSGVITGGTCDGLEVAKAGSAVRVEEGGSLEINGGTITDNNTVSVFSLGSVKMTGGAIKNTKVNPSVNNVAAWGLEINGNENSAFTMSGGEISGNVVGVNISVGTMKLSGGTICDNKGLFGGIFFNSANAKLELSGDPVIRDNRSENNKPSNIWAYFNNKITIAGELKNTTPIGVRVGSDGSGTGAFTDGWKDYMGDADPADYFTSDNTDYEVSLSKDGEAQIAPPVVPDVSATGFEGDYDSEAHSITVTAPEGAEIKYGTEQGSYTLSESPTYTDAGTYTVYYEISKSGYTSVYGSAEVKIDQISAVVTVTGNNSTVNYDGKAHSVSGYTATADTELYDVTKDFTFSGTAQAERTDAGTTEMGLAADQFENTNDNFKTVTFNVTDGYQKITPLNVKVTITGHHNTVDYDGKAHSADGYDAEADSALYDVTKDFTYNGRAEAIRTNAGTTDMGLTAEQFENTNSNFATVTFDVTDGYIEIKPIDVTVTVTGHSDTVDYDGKAHSVDGYDAVADNELYDVTKDFTFSGTTKAERTNAGTTDMGLSAEQFANTNSNFATVTFDVTDGYIEIKPIDVRVTITGHNDTVDYDGKAHIAEGYEAVASTDLYDVAKDFTFSGRAEAIRTNAGTSMMNLTADKFENTNSNFATVTFNVTDGYITVKPVDVVVTITGHSDTVDYDGKAHSVDGYDAVADNELYDVTKDFTFSGTTKAERTNAGTTDMGLEAKQFVNTNSNFANVAFEVTDGYITVKPVDVVVTITGHSDTVDYDGKAHSVDGYDAVASSNLYDVNKDFTFSGRAEAVRTNVGTTKMNLSADKFKNTNTNFANVTFNVTDGFLTVNPVDAVITTAPHAKSELIYNGSEQELIAAGAADGGTLYYALGDDAKTAPADESYTTAIPTAAQIGNYYIWYMVKGDSNHNDLSASCMKITMADQGWGTVSGAVVDENHSPVKNATVSLIIGGRVIDEIASGSDGSYYFTVPAGIYNIVVKSSDATATEMVNVSDRTTYDLTVPDSDTDSVLDIVDTDSRIVVGGLSKEAAAVRNTEGVSADQNVSVRMTVKTVSESDTTGSQAISGIAGDMFVEYYDCKVEKTVDTVTTSMDKTQTVLELVIPCSYTNKRELTVYNSDGSGAQTLTLSDSREAGTFRVDQNAGLVYIYTDRIATYAVGYKPYYSIKSEVSLGSFSGNVSVKLTKDTTGETYALNNVSLNSISFTGLPKGTYSMTITWTDGAENTLTTPFIIK